MYFYHSPDDSIRSHTVIHSPGCAPAPSCPPRRGKPGPTGPLRGPTGPTGPTGPSGVTGATGATGSQAAADLLSAYASPSQAGTSGSNLIFDRNSLSLGNSVTHPVNSSTFTITSPGVYQVSFHGSVSPAGDTIFPLAMIISLLQNGSVVPGATAQCSLTSANDVENMAFSQIINVTQAPAALTVRGTGGNFFYSNNTLSINKLGPVSSTT